MGQSVSPSRSLCATEEVGEGGAVFISGMCCVVPARDLPWLLTSMSLIGGGGNHQREKGGGIDKSSDGRILGIGCVCALLQSGI